MRLRYLTSAYHDLSLIYEYIARENPTAARRVITAIRKEAQILTEHPHIGKPGQVEGTREQVGWARRAHPTWLLLRQNQNRRG